MNKLEPMGHETLAKFSTVGEGVAVYTTQYTQDNKTV